MLARNCKEADLQWALVKTNESFGDNVQFRSMERKGNAIRFTLRVASSKGPGHARTSGCKGGSPRRSIWACWHVHGEFFSHLLKVAPKVVIISNTGMKGKTLRITKQEGNWTDWVVAWTNPFGPCVTRKSDLCECGKGAT